MDFRSRVEILPKVGGNQRSPHLSTALVTKQNSEAEMMTTMVNDDGLQDTQDPWIPVLKSKPPPPPRAAKQYLWWLILVKTKRSCNSEIMFMCVNSVGGEVSNIGGQVMWDGCLVVFCQKLQEGGGVPHNPHHRGPILQRLVWNNFGSSNLC